MDSTTFLFYALALLTGGCSVAVVVSQNIVRAAAWLLFTLAGVSGIFFLLGASFVGATQLLVYVGGTLVLVVFGVMLTAQGPFIKMKIGAAEWAIATAVGLLLYTLLVLTLVNSPAPYGAEPADLDDAKSVTLGLALLGDKDATPAAPLTGGPEGPRPGAAAPAEAPPPPPRGGGPGAIAPPTFKPPPRERRRNSYLFPFEIVSVHLLVVLIGAAYLARAKRRRGAAS
jgi:NADH-quinone oxidoreductase subunit J